MNRGEVWRVRFPSGQGHAQSGERPAIIVQDTPRKFCLPTTLVVPMTSKVRATQFDGTLLIQPNHTNGLTMPSIAMVFQMRMVEQANCLRRIGAIEPAELDQIYSILDDLLGR